MNEIQASQFLQMCALLFIQMATGAGAAILFRKIFNLAFVIGCFIVTIILIFVAGYVAKVESATGIFIVSALFGASVGADLGGFALAIGNQYGLDEDEVIKGVTKTLGIIAVATGVAAAVGLFSGFNFTSFGPILGGILLIIVIVGLINLVVGGGIKSFAYDMFICLFFVVYMVYDFNKVMQKYDQATWGRALKISMNIYLDIVNIFVHLLQYILQAKKK